MTNTTDTPAASNARQEQTPSTQMPAPKRLPPTDPSKTQINFLSLYMMILGFFVVLVSMSKISEERMSQVRSETRLLVNPFFSLPPDLRRFQLRKLGETAGDILTELENFFKREVDLVETLFLLQRETLYAQFPMHGLFAHDQTQLTAKGQQILRRISQSAVNLNNRQTISRKDAFVVDITVRIAQQDGTALFDLGLLRQNLNRDRLLQIANFLEGNDVPVDMLAITLEQIPRAQLLAALKISEQAHSSNDALVLFRFYPLEQSEISASPFHLLSPATPALP